MDDPTRDLAPWRSGLLTAGQDMRSIHLVILAFATVLLAAACSEEDGDGATGGDVLARVAGQPVSEASFAAWLDHRAGDRGPASEGQYKSALDDMIESLLIADIARERGVTESEGFKAKLALIRATAKAQEQALMRSELIARLEASGVPDDASLNAFYDTQKTRFLARAMELAELRFASIDRARDAVAALRRQPQTDEGFHGGDAAGGERVALGWVTRTALPATHRAALSGLRAGAPVSRAFAVDDGAVVLVLYGEREAVPRPFAEVRAQLGRELSQRKAASALDELLATAREEVSIDEMKLTEFASIRLRTALPSSLRLRPPRDEDADADRGH